MTSPTQAPVPPPAAPSLSKLAATTAVALAVAAVILVTLVLPAEYGFDPTGIGRALGLTAISSPAAAAVEPQGPATAALVPKHNGPLGTYAEAFKFDVLETELAPYEYVEYKYRLEKDATMLYSWTATGALKHDLHGERAGAGEAPAEQSFDKEDPRQASGTLTAPFAGIHGWYWENPGAEPITIRLTSAGYYTSAVEIRSDRTRQTRTLRTIDTLHKGDVK